MAFDLQNAEALKLIVKSAGPDVLVYQDSQSRVVFSIVAKDLKKHSLYVDFFLESALKKVDPVTKFNVADLLWIRQDQAGLIRAFDLGIVTTKPVNKQPDNYLAYDIFILARGYYELLKHIIEKKSINPYTPYSVPIDLKFWYSKDLASHGPFASSPTGENEVLFIDLLNRDMIRYMVRSGKYQVNSAIIAQWIRKLDYQSFDLMPDLLDREFGLAPI